jgi:ubiquinone/menaquinone biosynthesis C-methylase UbiE
MGRLATAGRDGSVFDEIAAEYDRSRPAYPDELVDRACEVAGIRRGDPVLEVGCGTGQLTRSLLARGLRVVAVEPGKHLMALAERNLDGRGEVEFVNARLEDAKLPRGRYRALFSAAAFHWIDPHVSWQKAARLLAPGGTLALIQYCGLENRAGADDQRALLSALARTAPELAADWPAYRDLAAIAAGVQQRRENVSEAWAWVGSQDVARADAGHLFCDVQIVTVPIVVEHTADELTGLVRSASFYARLPPNQRRAIENEHAVIYERLGRPIRSSMVAVLLTARRRGAV